MKYIIGIDVGGTNIEYVILPENARSEKEAVYLHTEYPKGAACHDLCRNIADSTEKLISQRGIALCDIASVGIATPGGLDVKRGIIIDAYNLDLHNAHITEGISECLGFDGITLLNDADAATLGEHAMGALQGKDSGILITLGTGVGAGLIIDGNLYQGGRMRGTEYGHMTLDLHGDKCTCKNTGCIETLCSATYIEKKGRELFCNEKMTAKDVFDMAKNGDENALMIFNEYVDNLGAAIASYITLLDPEIVALGGGVSLAGDFLTDAVKVCTQKHCFFSPICDIVTSRLGNKSGVIGAAFAGR